MKNGVSLYLQFQAVFAERICGTLTTTRNIDHEFFNIKQIGVLINFSSDMEIYCARKGPEKRNRNSSKEYEKIRQSIPSPVLQICECDSSASIISI